jgi:hypothetical protein
MNNSLWVVWNGDKQKYLAHPRGEWTSKIEEAYGWHYKADCESAVKHMFGSIEIGRRRDFARDFLNAR